MSGNISARLFPFFKPNSAEDGKYISAMIYSIANGNNEGVLSHISGDFDSSYERYKTSIVLVQRLLSNESQASSPEAHREEIYQIQDLTSFESPIMIRQSQDCMTANYADTSQLNTLAFTLLYNLGLLLAQTGKYQESHDMLLLALKTRSLETDEEDQLGFDLAPKVLLAIHFHLAQLSRLLGRYQEAFDYFTECITFTEASDDIYGVLLMAQVFSALGSLLIEGGYHAEADVVFEEARNRYQVQRIWELVSQEHAAAA